MNIIDDLTIIFLIYKSENIIKEQLAKLKKFKIIIVDNNNNDTFKSFVNKNYKNVLNYHLSKKNVGFAKGNNIGANLCNTKYVLFLNPDLFIDQNSIINLLHTFKTFDNIGVVGPMLCNEKFIPDGNSSLNNEKLKIVRNPFEKKIFNKIKSSLNQSYLCCDQIWGACMLFETVFFNKIGGFDDDFFIYYEDSYICRKIKLNNKVVMENAHAEATHLKGVSATYTFLEKAKLKFHHKLSEYVYLNKISYNFKFLLIINFFDYLQRSFFNIFKFKFKNSFTNLMRIFAIIIFILNKFLLRKYD